MDFEQVVRRRRMVRNYSSEEVDPACVERILDIARRGPSAGFSQGQSFVVITDPAMRAEIAAAANESHNVELGMHPWISRAPVLVVCCTSEAVYRSRYSEPDKLNTDGALIEWPVPYWYFDAGCSVMLLLLAAVNEGLAAGFLGLQSEGYARLRDLLAIPDEVTPVGLVTIGKPAPDRRSSSLKRGWRPTDQIIHWEAWGSAPEPRPPDGT